MAKIKKIDYIKGISGKTSKDSDYYYYTNKLTGETSMRRIGIDKKKPATPAQLASRAAFAEKTRTIKEWFDTNKPSTEHPEGTQAYIDASHGFHSQSTIGDIYHYVWHMLFTNNK